MDTTFAFQPSPHEEAAALIAGKPPLAKRVFMELLPELRARAFTVAGIENANILQQIRDEVEALPRGQTWAVSKKNIADLLTPSLGEDGADRRADLVLRTNSFQAFSAASHRGAMEDAGTTHLQYLHGNCKVPTPSHLALNGLILPKDNPFWLTHTGPWGHLGCVCYTRSMSPEQVSDEQDADAKRNPEDKLVLTGPAVTKLNEGTLVRNGRAYDVAPPTGPDAFTWHPNDLQIPLDKLKDRYDPEVWNAFEQFAKATEVTAGQSVWDWLNRESLPAHESPQENISFLKPQEKPQPSGPPVSGHVANVTSGVKQIVNHAMAQIDKVHGDGGLPSVQIDGRPGRGSSGVFRVNENSIGLAANGPHPELTLAHEAGHWIDRRAFALPPFKFMSESDLGAAWRTAVEQSTAYKQLRQVDPKSPKDSHYLSYLTSWKELWARSYAQFIAENSGDERMLKQLQGRLQGGIPQLQWSADDFVNIGQEIRKLLTSLGWIK